MVEYILTMILGRFKEFIIAVKDEASQGLGLFAQFEQRLRLYKNSEFRFNSKSATNWTKQDPCNSYSYILRISGLYCKFIIMVRTFRTAENLPGC